MPESVVPPGRCFDIAPVPTVETVGYSQSSRRDEILSILQMIATDMSPRWG